MKTLILYTTTYGYAEECANKLAEKLGGADVVNAEKGAPSLNGYEAVVIGGSVYMGQIQKKLKEYMEAHKAELLTKKLGLFLCSGLAENAEQEFKANFPAEMLESAAAKEYFGGVLDKSKMSMGHRMITKMMESAVKKEGKSGPMPKPENIGRLAEAMR